MALSDEQNAMLRLLASGEQGYEDIAALLGQSVDEVRAKVVGALAQLQAEGKPAPDIPPPLSGGAHPAAEAAAPEPEPISEPPAGEEPAAEPVIADQVAPRPPAEPKAPAPEPKPTAPKAAPRTTSGPASSPASGGSSSGSRTITLPTGRKAWLWGGGVVGAIVVIVVVILLVSGGGGGNGSSSGASEGNGGTATNAKTAAGEEEKGATQAQLRAVDGSEAAGKATFGRYNKKLALAIEATGLEPTEEGKTSYTVWLAKSPTKMLPLFSTSVKAKGKGANTIAGEYEVPVEILAYLASETFDQLAVTLTDNDQLEASIEEAKKEKSTPAYTGTAVLRGTITGQIVGYAKREEEEKKEESGE